MTSPATARANGRITACATGYSVPSASTTLSVLAVPLGRLDAVLPLGAADARARRARRSARSCSRARRRRCGSRRTRRRRRARSTAAPTSAQLLDAGQDDLGCGVADGVEVRREDDAVARRARHRRRRGPPVEARRIDEDERGRRERAHVRRPSRERSPSASSPRTCRGLAVPGRGSLIGSKPRTPGSSLKRATIPSHAARYCGLHRASRPPRSASNALRTSGSFEVLELPVAGSRGAARAAFGIVQEGKPSPQKLSAYTSWWKSTTVQIPRAHAASSSAS